MKKINDGLCGMIRSLNDDDLVHQSSSIRIAPPSASSNTIGFDPSPSATEALARRLERSSPFVRPASSASRLRLVRTGVRLTGSDTGGSGSFGLRGISMIFSSATGFSSVVAGVGLY